MIRIKLLYIKRSLLRQHVKIWEVSDSFEGAGRFRTCAGAGPLSLVWLRAGSGLPALARCAAPRGVPVQVGNRSAAPTVGWTFVRLYRGPNPLVLRASRPAACSTGT
jgi:hypothetical protein